MATPFRINIEAGGGGLMGLRTGSEEAAKVTELLQADLEIIHHLLTLYGTGAKASDLQKAFDANRYYQLKAMKPREDVVRALEEDWSNAKDGLGKGRQYSSFLGFFQKEIERLGWREVLLEYLFKEDEKSRDLQRLVHPLIQLSYGLEWEQPAIIASALALASVHSNSLHEYLTRCHSAAASKPAPPSTLLDLYLDASKDGAIAAASRWEDNESGSYGVLERALPEAIDLASRVRVKPEHLEEKTAEMMHATAYVAAAAAFHPPHVPRFDFFLIHQLTAAPLFLCINKQPWIPTTAKARLLESKMRVDILQYLARGSPTLHTDLLLGYRPRGDPRASGTEDLLPRVHAVVDDGHTVKVARAMILAQRACRPYGDRAWVRLGGDEAWWRMVHLLLDANEQGGASWVRGAGFEEAWRGVPKQEASFI